MYYLDLINIIVYYINKTDEKGSEMAKFKPDCPICGEKVTITRFYCPACNSRVDGAFEIEKDPFAALSTDQFNFLLAFVRAEGRLNRLEEVLGMSYPTLKNRLNEVIRSLGYEPEQEKRKGVTPAERMAILDELENGRITHEQALRYLQGEEPFISRGA